MSSSKEKTHYHILRAYETYGLETALRFCADLLALSDTKRLSAGFDKVSTVSGKLCESVLEIMLLDYIKQNKLKDWFYVSSLYLRDVVTQNKEFFTEIDMVLFTPQVMFLLECKNYKGFKFLRDKGTLVKPKTTQSFDVYAQQAKHLEVFVSIFDVFKLDRSKRNGYQLGLFDYSIGTLEDRREDDWKTILPVVNKDNLYSYLDSFRNRSPKWDMDGVRRAVELLERDKDTTAAKHLAYVKRLHGKK